MDKKLENNDKYNHFHYRFNYFWLIPIYSPIQNIFILPMQTRLQKSLVSCGICYEKVVTQGKI